LLLSQVTALLQSKLALQQAALAGRDQQRARGAAGAQHDVSMQALGVIIQYAEQLGAVMTQLCWIGSHAVGMKVLLQALCWVALKH
jgi:hypothetical protein